MLKKKNKEQGEKQIEFVYLSPHNIILPHEDEEEEEEDEDEEEDEEGTFFRCNKKQAKAAHVEGLRDYLDPT